jgi:hypothetical protein
MFNKGALKALMIVLGVVFVMTFVVGMMPGGTTAVATEVEVLIRPYADSYGPPTTVTFSGADLYVWWGKAALVLSRNSGGAWYIAGMVQDRDNSIPPLFVALMVQHMRELQEQGKWQVKPIAPWSVTARMPEEALHPEVR